MAVRSLYSFVAALLLPVALWGCKAQSPGPQSTLSPEAQKWLVRARDSYRTGDIDDARESAKSALAAAPDNPDVRVAAGRIHLARLEFDETIRVLQGLDISEARALRGRAKWYKGDLDGAAEDLEALLQDPGVRDEWARTISKLARRGTGRQPFLTGDGLLAAVPMLPGRGPSLIVPIEIDGEQGLALVATNKTEVVLDSSTRKEPSWVQLRFADRLTVSNVPTLTEDLSGYSKEVNAPIKALLGSNLLRRFHVTFDLLGGQFVVRTKEPPPPPKATRISLSYALGGAMFARISLRPEAQTYSPLLVNTLLAYPVALDEPGWKSAGVDLSSLQAAPGLVRDSKVKGTTLPLLRIGAFDVAGVPTFFGPTFSEIRNATGVDLEGAIGVGLLYRYRCTLAAEGRALWIEDFPEDDPYLNSALPMSERGTTAPPTPSNPGGPSPSPLPTAPAGPQPVGPKLNPGPSGPPNPLGK